jgi:hypothetical protein
MDPIMIGIYLGILGIAILYYYMGWPIDRS